MSVADASVWIDQLGGRYERLELSVTLAGANGISVLRPTTTAEQR